MLIFKPIDHYMENGIAIDGEYARHTNQEWKSKKKKNRNTKYSNLSRIGLNLDSMAFSDSFRLTWNHSMRTVTTVWSLYHSGLIRTAWVLFISNLIFRIYF